MKGIVSLGVCRKRLSVLERSEPAEASAPTGGRSELAYAPAARALGSGCTSGLTTTMGGAGDALSG